MRVKPRQNPIHHFGSVSTEPLMVGTADHHQLRISRIGIPQAFRRFEPIRGAVNEEHAHLAAAYRRDAILGISHIEAEVEAYPPERRFD